MNVVFGKWNKIVDGYGQMVLGYFGETPRPADPEVIKIAAQQLGKEPFTGDPLDVIEPGIPAATKILQDNNLPVTEENIFIIASCEGKGLDFLQGKSPLSVYYKEDEKKTDAKPAAKAAAPALGGQQNLIINVNGKDYNVSVRPDGTVLSTAPAAPAPAAAAIPADATVIKAPMPGTMFKVLVKEGDEVQSNQAVVILEAMKMENEIQTPKAGKVLQVLVNEGDPIEEGKVLVVIA